MLKEYYKIRLGASQVLFYNALFAESGHMSLSCCKQRYIIVNLKFVDVQRLIDSCGYQ